MSGIILCRSREVKEPYYVEDLGIYLYSGEELSYYIYHNATLIGPDFLDERLFRFVGQELGMEKLEGKLRRWTKQADLSELLLVILQDIHYYDSEELFAFKQKMTAREKKTAGVKMREQADALLRAGRTSGALLAYDRLLHSGCPEMMDETFRGKVWLSRGTAYARQYDWQSAAFCLEKAYGLLREEPIRKKLYLTSCLDPAVRLPKEIQTELTPEETAAWKSELEECQQQARFAGKGQLVSELLEEEKTRRARDLTGLVSDWKREYQRSLGMT